MNWIKIVAVACFVGCTTTTIFNVSQATTPSVDAALVEHLKESTVALVDANDTGSYANLYTSSTYCAGVWISTTQILTANHCAIYTQNTVYQTHDQWYVPSGDRLFYASFDDVNGTNVNVVRSARVMAYSTGDDLAVLLVDQETAPDMHHHVKMSKLPIYLSMRVNIIGHPRSEMWTYTNGYVANDYVRKCDDTLCNAIYTHVIHVTAAITFGNSGGGAYDQNGDLLGILSWKEDATPLMAVFIHRDVIRDFLTGL